MAFSVPFTVTVIVVVPNRFATGVMFKLRLEPEPEMAILAFGTNVVLLDVAVTLLIGKSVSPKFTVTDFGVSSLVN